MTQQTAFFTVSQFNASFKEIIEGTPVFKNIWVKGEVTSLKHYQYGRQLYFTLAEGDCSMNGVMYSRAIGQVKQMPKTGEEVYVRGSMTFFRKKGQLIFQAHAMSISGKGLQHQSLEKLQATLQEEGIFDSKHKQLLPNFPKKIGIVTSYKSAAMFDVLKICRDLFPGIQLVVSPAVVQGDLAVPTIIEAMNNLEGECDVVLLCRGGGSVDDLSVFNSETLVRHIFACKTPVVSAIGHESDFTLTDLVADRRCATPSEAAMVLLGSYREAHDMVAYVSQLRDSLAQKIIDHKEKFSRQLQEIDRLVGVKMSQFSTQVAHVIQRVELASPLRKIRQGFSICGLNLSPETRSVSDVITSISEVKLGDNIYTQLKDGHFKAEIKHKYDQKYDEIS